MAHAKAAPSRQAKAAGMMMFIVDTPVHRYDGAKLIAGRQLCSVGRHIGAVGSLKMRIFVMANTRITPRERINPASPRGL